MREKGRQERERERWRERDRQTETERDRKREGGEGGGRWRQRQRDRKRQRQGDGKGTKHHQSPDLFPAPLTYLLHSQRIGSGIKQASHAPTSKGPGAACWLSHKPASARLLCSSYSSAARLCCVEQTGAGYRRGRVPEGRLTGVFILAAPSVYPLMTPCPRANQSCWHTVSKHRNSSRVPE